jgi:hypothetical protein
VVAARGSKLSNNVTQKMNGAPLLQLDYTSAISLLLSTSTFFFSAYAFCLLLALYIEKLRARLIAVQRQGPRQRTMAPPLILYFVNGRSTSKMTASAGERISCHSPLRTYIIHQKKENHEQKGKFGAYDEVNLEGTFLFYFEDLYSLSRLLEFIAKPFKLTLRHRSNSLN